VAQPMVKSSASGLIPLRSVAGYWNDRAGTSDTIQTEPGGRPLAAGGALGLVEDGGKRALAGRIAFCKKSKTRQPEQ